MFTLEPAGAAAGEAPFDRDAESDSTGVAAWDLLTLDLPEYRLDLTELRAVRQQEGQVQTPTG
jgi:hypothetical protein